MPVPYGTGIHGRIPPTPILFMKFTNCVLSHHPWKARYINGNSNDKSKGNPPGNSLAKILQDFKTKASEVFNQKHAKDHSVYTAHYWITYGIFSWSKDHNICAVCKIKRLWQTDGLYNLYRKVRRYDMGHCPGSCGPESGI